MPCAVNDAAAKTAINHIGGRANSHTNRAAKAGARSVIASTPAAHASAGAATSNPVPASRLSVSTATEPAAAPVAKAGVIKPPTAPVRRYSAVSNGFRNRMTTAPPSVRLALTLTVRMLLPLPGNSGHQIEQIPVARPAMAIAGISGHDRRCGTGRAHAVTLSNANPTATATGATAHPKKTNRYERLALGHTTECSRCVTGADTATARLEVISAVPMAFGCQEPSTMRAA